MIIIASRSLELHLDLHAEAVAGSGCKSSSPQLQMCTWKQPSPWSREPLNRNHHNQVGNRCDWKITSSLAFKSRIRPDDITIATHSQPQRKFLQSGGTGSSVSSQLLHQHSNMEPSGRGDTLSISCLCPQQKTGGEQRPNCEGTSDGTGAADTLRAKVTDMDTGAAHLFLPVLDHLGQAEDGGHGPSSHHQRPLQHPPERHHQLWRRTAGRHHL